MEQGTKGSARNQSLAAWKVWLDEFLADDGNADSAQPPGSVTDGGRESRDRMLL